MNCCNPTLLFQDFVIKKFLSVLVKRTIYLDKKTKQAVLLKCAKRAETYAVPVQCSTKWANKLTESWSLHFALNARYQGWNGGYF